MEHNVKSYPTTDVIKRAVEQCNRIESSLEGCLQVLQQSRVSSWPDFSDVSSKTTPQRLNRKLSYTVCDGKKSPDLIEVDESSDLRDNSNIHYMLKCADVKLQHVLASQQRIMQRMGDVHDSLVQKHEQHQAAYERIKQQWDKLK